MAYYVYILYSPHHDRFYIGQTSDLSTRLTYHNEGECFSTAPYRPWTIVYKQECNTRAEAMKRERELKAKKSKSYLKWFTKIEEK